ncbi:MAG: hypothetical protein EXQ69_00600 [Acidimicrobiia bacterium]|nr:hypothetical protein [Acidimicrobiia bacterium]
MNGPDLDMLSAYLDGELTEDERTIVDARLLESEEWRVELAETASVRSLVRGLPEKDIPAGFLESLTAPDLVEVTTIDTRRRPMRAMRWLTGAAAAAVVAGVFLIPSQATNTPTVAADLDQHHAVQSTQSDPVMDLASIGVSLGTGK